MSAINIRQIETNVKAVVAKYNEKSFIYDFLLAYGLPKATIKRQQLNSQGQPALFPSNDVFFKKKVYFRVDKRNQLPLVISELADENGSAIRSTHPRFVIATDFKRFMAIDTKTKDSLDTPFAELPTHYAFFLPWAGMEKSAVQIENPADVKAAERMAKLFDEIKRDNPDFANDYVHGLNVFLTRLLFCFFAEDTAIFPKGAFTQAIESYTQVDGSDLGDFLTRLFAVLNTPEKLRNKDLPDYLQQFPYVNGGLFRDAMPLPSFSPRSRNAIIKSGELDWAAINPDIFGSMIQNVVTDEDRGDLGIHYTSVPNIMKVIQPLFLDELHREFEEACVLRTDVKDPKKAKNERLKNLLGRISTIRIFDPACGSGNFLIIAYRELRKLEIAILKELDMFSFSSIQLQNFYGIEISDFSCEVSKLSLWLAEHQMNMIFKETLGQCNPTLPLQEAGKIVCANATRINWAEVCPRNGQETYILSNPPYLGARLQEDEHKSDLDYALKDIEGRNNLDYISAWFVKGAHYISGMKFFKIGFVTTNSVCQGEQVALLWPHVFKHNVEFFFAYESFKWANNAKYNAGVTCTILGLRNIDNSPKFYYKEGMKLPFKNINAYLVDADDVYIDQRKKSISDVPAMCFGSMPNDGGNLILTEEDARAACEDDERVKAFLRPMYGGDDFINDKKRYCLWISESQFHNAMTVPFIKKRVDAVLKYRSNSKRAATQKLASVPYRFGEVRHRDSELIVVPATSSERRMYIPIGFLPSGTIVNNAAQVIFTSSIDLFGIITSYMHMLWVRTVGGRLKTDYRYSATLCYNTFPFPHISEQQKEELSELAQQVLFQREMHSEKTLAELYDPDKMPDELKAAHHQLDLAVERCYRSKPFESDEERLEHLFNLYEKMIASEEKIK